MAEKSLVQRITKPIEWVLLAAECPQCGDKFGITQDEKVGVVIAIHRMTFQLVEDADGEVICGKCGEVLETEGHFYVQTGDRKWLLLKTQERSSEI